MHGEQEGASHNGYFKSVCYHPPFCFNQYGDCEEWNQCGAIYVNICGGKQILPVRVLKLSTEGR